VKNDDPLQAYRDDDEAEQLSPRVVHNHHYSQSKANGNGNGNGLNKVIWAIAGVLAIMILGIQSFVAAKVWDISERLARVEARQEIQQRPP
jgi:hypothetical protein